MLLSADNKFKVKRRKQFCNVMIGDLVQLSRAENWNDQYFTDLEAEVEIEGGYYASAWDALRRKKSYGLRKESSLIRAITSSAERALQLIGEPGSGKSVALRHLAMQLAEHGKKSNDKNSKVPLYVNLREMDVKYTATISADDVRKFVLDNIRRGDADTSSYVRENWDDYCNRGIWLFLFDSFDEIPEVLHSAVGSTVVKQYSEAIRQFLDGMGECKGILASREFKGPEALPWKKLRILPLSGEKQDELIKNSSLSESNLKIVRQHLASSHSSTGSTPLFLTLLCRDVRDEKRAPHSDHDILIRHINRLACREPERLLSKYRFTVEELVLGAERLARLFAENDNLSLAPTLDLIKTHLPDDEVPTKSIERLVLALVDCKIGRADVPNAATGDRRFAFAHRRYQEALFVGYLARNPNALSYVELLKEPRWREYTVTLLQTGELHQIQGLLHTACSILEERVLQQTTAWTSIPPLPSSVSFYDWENEEAIPLLALLQEGMARRLMDVPVELSASVDKFLEPRWSLGDTYDRCLVLKLGGLLPHDRLLDYLSTAFSTGTTLECAQAFKLAVYCPALPAEVQNQVLEALSDEVIEAKTRADQLSIEALASRLPDAMGASYVVERGHKIRRRFHWVGKAVSTLFSVVPKQALEKTKFFLSKKPSAATSRELKRVISPPIAALFFPMIFIGFLLVTKLIELGEHSDLQGWITVSLLSVGFVMVGMICFPYMIRTYNKRMTILGFVKWCSEFASFKILVVLGKLLVGFTLFMVATVPFGYLIEWGARRLLGVNLVTEESYNYPTMMGLGLLSLMLFLYAVGFVALITQIFRTKIKNRRWIQRLHEFKQAAIPDYQILYSASDLNELRHWLRSDSQILAQRELLRGFSSLTLSVLRQMGEANQGQCNQKLNDLPPCYYSDHTSKYRFEGVLQLLEDKRFVHDTFM